MSKDCKTIMVFGEVLFDVFPDGTRVIGGAPFNVACHLKGFSHDPLFVSRIGRDGPGREVKRVMESRSLSIAGLQEDSRRPTGEVRVSIEDDEPSYEIMKDAAYDFIREPMEKQVDPEDPLLLYHGTLAARNSVSADTLYRLARQDNTSVFCDINLRDPWWEEGLVMDILNWCTYLKVNEEELERVCRLERLSRSAGYESMARDLAEKRGLNCLIVTMGVNGAMLFPAGKDHLSAPAPQAENFQDSVGAGDAFSAVFLAGIIRGWTWKKILHRAVDFAARICGNKGAIPEDKHFYKQTRQIWERENGEKKG